MKPTKKTLRSTFCPYCHEKATLVSGKEAYPHRPDLYNKRFWLCRDCNAWVGVHENSKHPLGRLANKELRQAKIRAHSAFDPLWKKGYMTRRDAYKWLAEKLGIKPKRCHIGWFDVGMCDRVVGAVSEYGK